MSVDAGAAAPAANPNHLHGFAFVSAIFLLALANFMALLDITIVNVAVPHIAGSLAISPNEGTWVITSYAVAEAITVPLSGWLSTRFGSVRVFVTAAICFGIFSMLCGMAPNLTTLVLFRVLQGLAGGPLMPMSQTLLMRVSPPRHAQLAIGLQMMTTIVAPIAGPYLGGMITDSVGWPWAFYINVPISVICAGLVWRLMASRDTAPEKKPVDYVGLGLLIFWIGALQIMLDNGENEDWFASPLILGLAIAAAIGFVAFLIWELTDEHPIVDLTVFRYRTFAILAAAMALAFGSFMSTVVLIPLWLQTNMSYTATSAGDLMAFQGVLGVVVGPIAALLVSRIDPRVLMSFGLGLMSALTLWRTTFAQNITFWQLVLPQVLTGIAIPTFFVPLLGISVASVPARQTASAAGLVHFIRTVASAFGTAMVTSTWDRAATSARSDLVGALHRPQTMLGAFQAMGQSHDQALQSLSYTVQSQAVMLATNHVFQMLAFVLAGVAAAVWATPRPRGSMVAAGAH